MRFTEEQPVNWRFPKWRTTRYSQYLESTHWKLFRFNIFAKRGMRCERCASVKDINIHHKTYKRLGCELPEDVEVLCRVCHGLAHLTTREELKLLFEWTQKGKSHPGVRHSVRK